MLPALPVPLPPLAQEVTDLQVLEACGEAPSFLCETVLDATGNEGLAKLADYVITAPLRILLILLGAYLLNRLARRAIRHFIQEMKDPDVGDRIGRMRQRTGLAMLDTSRIPRARRAQRADAIGAVLRSGATAIIWGIALVMSLAELNVAIGPILASAGIVGIAVGFGAQDVVKDFLSGLFMLLEDQYGVGDIIDVGDASGVVEGLTLRSTRIRDVYGTLWHVPNGEIRRVGNKSQQWARALLDIPVGYGTDLDHASEVIKRVADETWRDEAWAEQFVDEPEIWGVENFGADGIDIRLVIKVVPSQQWTVQRELRRRIKAAFDEEGIEIPFPQRTVWLRTDLTGSDSLPRIETASPDGDPPPAPRRRARVRARPSADEDDNGRDAEGPPPDPERRPG